MDFSKIKAYDNENVNNAISKLLNDSGFLKILQNSDSLLKIFNTESFSELLNSFKTIKTVKDFQSVMFTLLKYNLNTTTDGLSYSNEQNVLNNKNVLFVSNHRSTSLDAAYLNYVLNYLGLETAYCGAGDNIFETKWLGHLIRLSKGFIIKRNVEDIDEKIHEAIVLSSYINSLLMRNNYVWISQQPGRAKNGIDTTDSVVITMLKKFDSEKGYDEWLEQVCLIPVCISWEIVPRAEAMSEESIGNKSDDIYIDRKNILSEIISNKGRVHYNFGKRITGKKRGEIVKLIDNEILSNYRLWDTNWYAYSKRENLSGEDRKLILDNINTEKAQHILENSNGLTGGAKNFLLDMYANPVRMALAREQNLKSLMEKNLRFLAQAKFVD